MVLNKTLSFVAVPATLVVAGFITAGIATPAFAQSQAQEQESEEATVVVTGSRIRRIQHEGPSPIVVITANDLNNRGYNTVLEAINDLPQNAGGGFDQQFVFAFTPSASAVDLRGFGIGRSLVLIDGRRVPIFPLAANGTDNFVDLSSIPVAAVDRIEVVTDGASAIYGSDAVSGVINIILKKTTGNEVLLRRSDTTQGGGGQSRAQFATGLETNDGTTAVFFAEYLEQDRMMYFDRPYSRSDQFGGINGPGPGNFSAYGYPGTFIDDNGTPDTDLDDNLTPAANCATTNGSPGTVDGLCWFNRAQYRELLPDMDHLSLTAKIEKPFSENLSFFTRAMYLRSNVVTQFEPVPGATTLVPAANPNNPTGFDGFWVRRTVEFGPRIEDIDNDTYNIVTGLQGKLGTDFQWELGTQYAKQRVDSRMSGYFLSAGFDEAVTTGVAGLPPINLFDPIPQAVVDAIAFEPLTRGTSSIASIDFSLNGGLFDLPKGRAQFALAAEHAKQRFEDRRDPEVLAGNVEELGGTSGIGDRKYSALGVELELPVLTALTVNLAARYDNYDDASDVGSAVSPRISAEFRPTGTLLLRASAGKSFRAPDLQRLFGGTTTGFLDLIDTPQCLEDGGTGRGDPDVASCTADGAVSSVEIHTLTNRDLQEEKGRNANLGVVWEALPGLSMSADLWYIKLSQIVNTLDEQILLDQNAATGAHAEFIHRDCDLALNPGCLVFVESQTRNLSFQRATGLDTTLQYLWNTSTLGRFGFKLGSSYLDKVEIQESADQPTIDVLAAGTLGQFVRFKGNASVGWNRGPWNGMVYMNYIGPFTPIDTTTVKKVGSWTTVNVSAAYGLPWNGTIHLGVNNLFDRDPPLDLSAGANAQPFYNPSFHDPLGATWWLAYTQRF